MTISFVIPVYNCQKYIGRCLESILNSIFKDNEIILVNDGSKDGSLKVCESYSKNFSNIRVLSQENKGASTARNVGLSAATGDYIWFVDADDFLRLNDLILLDDYIEKYNMPDIIMFKHVVLSKINEKLENNNSCRFLTGSEVLRETDGRLFIWNKIYCRRFLTEHKLTFLDGTKNIEDFYFNIQALVFAKHVLNTTLTCYVYNDSNENSTSRSRDSKNLLKLSEDSITIHLKILEFMQGLSKVDNKILNRILMKSCAGFFYSLMTCGYDYKYIEETLHLYKENGLYPFKTIGEFKTDMFIRFVDLRRCFLAWCRLYRKKC